MNLSDQQIIDRFAGEPAPLLPILHALHERDGYLGEPALRAVAAALRTPIADLYGTVTFYHHFSQEPGGLQKPRVCTGNICCLRGGNDILERLKPEGATPMPCSGRCDGPVPVLKGNETWIADAGANLTRVPSPLPAPNPGGIEECVFSGIRESGRATLGGYRATGGYEALEKALREMDPDAVIDVITESKLAGRGGAGFPTGQKWRAVRGAPADAKWVVCNADEGEPGCFKDRAIMDYDPHALLEGMALAGFATGAQVGMIYLRYEYPETYAILEKAIAEAESAGLLGGDILGTGIAFKIYLRRGAGAYVCGEEGSLLNSLEGKHPFPRNKPPFPVTHGFNNQPTAVNNVETLAAAPKIVRRGAEWYRGLGLGDHAGTKVVSLSGDIARPGNYEIPYGLPLKTLLHEWGGGPLEGRAFQAVTMAGLSGGFLGGEALENATLDEPSIRSYGAFLGAAGIMVFDDRRDMREVARGAMEFFAHESCGKCFPCRIGTQRLTERLGGHAGPQGGDAWRDEVNDIGEAMKATSACGLGMAAPNITESLQRWFPGSVG